ncbi:hypothetical protein HJC99_03970 [Candidatus Saccharibacteria bacterium]|nr:hypothetical protein [Candidatus Saccharibacteria bacterium]
MLIPEGWLMIHHGVHRQDNGGLQYGAGLMLLDRQQPHRVIARSKQALRP